MPTTDRPGPPTPGGDGAGAPPESPTDTTGAPAAPADAARAAATTSAADAARAAAAAGAMPVPDGATAAPKPGSGTREPDTEPPDRGPSRGTDRAPDAAPAPAPVGVHARSANPSTNTNTSPAVRPAPASAPWSHPARSTPTATDAHPTAADHPVPPHRRPTAEGTGTGPARSAQAPPPTDTPRPTPTAAGTHPADPVATEADAAPTGPPAPTQAPARPPLPRPTSGGGSCPAPTTDEGAAAPGSARAAQPNHPASTVGGIRSAVWFMAPFFLLFALVTVAPIAYATWLSLFREEQSGLGFGGARRVFSGIGNYTKALSDPLFLASFRHVAAYCLLYIPVMVGGALLLALLLDSALARARRFFQIAFYLPHAVPGLVAAMVWLYLYTPGLSPVLGVLDSAGLSWNFFGRDEALLSVVNISAWQWTGYNMIIFFAGLQAIPREILEAATMDGAGAIRTALQVKVPSIRPTLVLTVLFTCVGAVQLFDAPQLLQLRATEMGESWSPTMYVFSAAFKGHDYGLAAASALLLALVAGATSYVTTKLGNRWRSA